MRAVNLIPADQRGGVSVGAGRSGGAAYAVLVVVAGVALMAFLYGQAKRQVSSRQAQATALTAQAQSAQLAASRLAPFTSFIALRQQRAQAVAQLVSSRFDWAHVFHEFGRVLPSDASISSLSGAVGASAAGGSSTSPGAAAATGPSSAAGASPPPAAGAAPAAGATPAAGAGAASAVSSATPPGSVPVFTVSGCAATQQAVAETINRFRLIDGVTNVALQSSTKGGGSGAGGGGCPANSPAFSMTVTFQALPVPAASVATVAPVAASSGPASSTGATSSGSVR